jgi:hypothetical protein
MSSQELLQRLEPDAEAVAAAIYSGADGEGLYRHEGPRRSPSHPVLPRGLQIVEPSHYIVTVAVAIWGGALKH